MSDRPSDVETIFLAALEKETPEERAAYLDEVCGDDDERRARVVALLSANDDAGSFLGKPLIEVAATAATDDSHEPPPRETPLDFLTPSDVPDHLGTLGQYEITELVGQGGMGIVLKGHDLKLNRVVAIKVLAPRLSVEATARRRFLREARAAAAVSHDHVVIIHAIDDGQQLPFLVMEYISGQSLQQRIDRAGPLELKEILRIGKQMASGLAAAHGEGLIHRDVKPANILLENGVERVKITDFGLARAANDASMTKAGVVCGTPEYMSPEQAQGLAVDHRTDLFSLGCVLYAMCTGRSPFRADSAIAVIRRVCDDTPRPIGEVNRDIPAWLVEITDRLLAKDPNVRLQSAAEVGELLGSHLAHLQRPGDAPCPAPLPPRPAEPCPARPARQIWLGVAAVVAIVGLVAWSVWPPAPAPSGADDVAPKPPPTSIDLMPVIVPVRDAPRRRWSIPGGGILLADSRDMKGHSGGYRSAIKLPYLMPTEYDLQFSVERPMGGGSLLICFALDGEVRRASIDGVLGPRPTTIRCEVRRGDKEAEIRVLWNDIPAEVKRNGYDVSWPIFDDGTVTIFDHPSDPGILKISKISLYPMTNDGRAVFGAQTASRDRQVAEEVLWRGGAVSLRLDGKEKSMDVRQLKDLPTVDFRLLGVDLRSPANVAGADGLLEGADDLKEICLRGQDVLSEERLLRLLALPSSLEGLDLGFTQVGNRGVASMQGLLHLRRLCVAGGAVSDEGLAHLAKAQSLEELDISGCKVTSVGVESLAELQTIRELDLDCTPIDDDALTFLQRLPELRVLSLADTNISAAAAESLANLRSLREISLVGTNVTTDGLETLEKALPNTAIEHSVGPSQDLLALVDLGEGAENDAWRRDGEAIVSPFKGGGTSREVQPAAPSEYVLETEFRSPSSVFRSVSLGLPYNGRRILVQIDSWPQLGCLSGLQLVDEHYFLTGVAGHEATVLGRLMSAGQTIQFRVVVRKNRITATCDDRLIVDWSGDLKRLGDRNSVGSGNDGFQLRAFQAACSFTKWQITPISRTGPAVDDSPSRTTDSSTEKPED